MMDPRVIMITECVKAVDPEVVLLTAPEPESATGERDYYYNLKKGSDVVGSVYTSRNNIIVHGKVKNAEAILSSKPPIPRCVVELEDPESAPKLQQVLAEIFND